MTLSAFCKSFKISRRGDQRRMAGAKDHRGRAAEARGCSPGHSGGQRGERFERAVREKEKDPKTGAGSASAL